MTFFFGVKLPVFSSSLMSPSTWGGSIPGLYRRTGTPSLSIRNFSKFQLHRRRVRRKVMRRGKEENDIQEGLTHLILATFEVPIPSYDFNFV